MNVLQRSISVVLFILLYLGMFFFSFSEQNERWKMQWQDVQLQRFVNQIKTRGECRYADYTECLEQLQLSGGYTLKISEYVKEEDIEGNKYYYFISWEEIKNELVEKHIYIFSEKSVLEVEMESVKDGKVKIKKYYSVVQERK